MAIISESSALSSSKLVSYRARVDGKVSKPLDLPICLNVAKQGKGVVLKEVLRVIKKGSKKEKIIREVSVLWDFIKDPKGRGKNRGRIVEKQEVSREEMRLWRRDLISWFAILPEAIPEDYEAKNIPAGALANLLYTKDVERKRNNKTLDELREVFPAPSTKEI